MDADRDRRVLVVGEHPLPRALLRERRGLGGRLERQRELAVAARDGLAAGGDAEPPEKLTPLPPLVARTRCDERLERVRPDRRTAREVAEVGVRLLRLDRPRVLLSDRLHVPEPDAYGTVLDRAFRLG